jgi:Ser/Thr protein kinase RdoA (MazF antagonist)
MKKNSKKKPEEIAQKYFNIVSTKSAKRIASGYVNSIWEIKSSNSKYALKKFSNQITHDQVFLSIRSQRYMGCCGLSPKLIQTVNGRLTCCYCNHFYTMSEWVETSDSKKSHLDEARNLGELLGELHTKFMRFSPIIGFSSALNWPVPRTEKFSHDSQISASEALELEIERKQCLNILNKNISDYSTLPKQWIHGDFHSGNVLKGENSLKVIDYDQVSYFTKIYEVIRGFFAYFPECYSDNSMTEKLYIYLKSYQAQFPLSLAEIELGLPLYLWVTLSDTSRRYNTPENVISYKYKKHLRAIDIFENIDKFQSVIMKSSYE